MSRWTAEVYRADRGQVGLRRPGDGRPDSDPWADPGTIYVLGAAEARALAAALIAAADATETANEPTPIPDGFILGPSTAMCGGRGPDHCRKRASCRKHNACVYFGGAKDPE